MAGEKTGGEVQQPSQLERYTRAYDMLDTEVQGYLDRYRREMGLDDLGLHGSRLSFETLQYDLAVIVSSELLSTRGYVVQAADRILEADSYVNASLLNTTYEAQQEDSQERLAGIRAAKLAIKVINDEHVIFNGLTLRVLNPEQGSQ